MTKLEFLSFLPIWADVNKHMHVSGTGVFLSLFLGNCKRTEQGRLFVWSFTHHLYSIQLVKHISLNLSLFHNSAEIFLTENEPCRQKLWNQGVLWEITRSNKTQKFSLTRIPNTKNKRNIFTHSALRYEMADESVSIKATTFSLCLFCPTTGKFRMSKGLCYEKCLQCTMRICSLWIMIC